MFDVEKTYRELIKTIEQAKRSGTFEQLLKDVDEDTHAVELQDYRVLGQAHEYNYRALSEFCGVTAADHIKEAMEQLGVAKAYLNYPNRVYNKARQLTSTAVSLAMIKKNSPEVLEFIKKYEDEHIDKKNKV